MNTITTCIIFSFLLSVPCNLFFETLLPKRVFRFRLSGHLALPTFMAGFLLIAFTPIPPFILQPVRFVLVVMLTALLYYEVDVIHSLAFSLLLCSIYWITSAFFTSFLYLLPPLLREGLTGTAENITDCIFFCLIIIFRHIFKGRSGSWFSLNWIFVGFFPFLSIVIILSFILVSEGGAATEHQTRFVTVSGFAVLNVFYFYFISKLLDKEEETQRLCLIHERTQNQMALYYDMQKSYDLQRRQLHDYKNQLGCIQGMLEDSQAQNALSYISRLTGTLAKTPGFISTGHNVVDIIVNRKYREAAEKGITMTLALDGLSELTLSEEEIVILLGNLLDNAIAACEKLDSGRIIRFKMVLESGQLILSVHNPTKEPVRIKENKITAAKKRGPGHGIGLLNVDSIIRKHGGTSVLKYDNGWFYFSAIIP